MKNGKLSEREIGVLRKACDILNRWCDWECDARELEGFDSVLDDVECSAASAAGLINEFLYAIED